MKIFKSLLFYTAGIILIVLLALLVINPKLEFEATQQQVQAAINNKLPFTSPSLGGVVITVNEGATATFGADGKVAIHAGFTAKPTLTNTTHFNGTFAGATGVSFRKGAFYVSSVDIGSVTGELVLSKRAEVAGKLLGKLKDKLTEKLDLEQGDIATLLGTTNLREKLNGFVTSKLENTPIPVKGTKWWHSIALSSVESVVVTEGKVTAIVGLAHIALLGLAGVAALGLGVLLIIAMANGGGGNGLGLLLTFGALGDLGS